MSSIDWVPELAAALDELVPPGEASRANWGDVVARAGRRRQLWRLPTRPRRGLRLAIVVALLFLLLAGVATATYVLVRNNGMRNPLTLFSPAGIVTIGGPRPTSRPKTIWHCPHYRWCGELVSFAWAPDGRRVAFTLGEIGGTSTYVGLHVVNVVSGRDRRVPGGAPSTATITDWAAWGAYLMKVRHHVGCFPAAELAWSADGSSLAYSCGPIPDPSGIAPGARIDVLRLRRSGHITIPTGSDAVWPSWSPSGTRIAYSTRLKPTEQSGIYTVALDGSHRRLLASGGAAPAWSPDGRTIAYQTKCGIRLVTPSGRDVTPRATANACGAVGLSGPPVWSPDGTKLAVEAKAGVYVMGKSGKALHRVSRRGTTTWYGDLPGRPSWRTGRDGRSRSRAQEP
jgi:hypothetical protein